MRMLMLPAHVTLRGRQPVLVSWREPAPESPRPAGLAEPSTPSRLPLPPSRRSGTASPPGRRAYGRAPRSPPAGASRSPDAAGTRRFPPREHAGRLHRCPVVRVLDRWRYDGRWWEHEVHRDYLLLELRGGSVVELFREGEAWWVARAND